ncbi:MAG: hypothetical protein NTV81_03695 [Candidatus Komeilibacteria bacterium]|nr:hypothetical protein [Candidatus Komeilibacteria bacterium]
MKLIIRLEYQQLVLAVGSLEKIIPLGPRAALSRIFLANWDSFFKKISKQKIKITAVAVSQVGPSFSALRTVLTFANLLAKQHSWPLVDLVSGKKISLAIPKYSKQPNITPSRKLLKY